MFRSNCSRGSLGPSLPPCQGSANPTEMVWVKNDPLLEELEFGPWALKVAHLGAGSVNMGKWGRLMSLLAESATKSCRALNHEMGCLGSSILTVRVLPWCEALTLALLLPMPWHRQQLWGCGTPTPPSPSKTQPSLAWPLRSPVALGILPMTFFSNTLCFCPCPTVN